MLTAGGSDERPYVETLLEGEEGVFVAASDYMKALPLSIARWFPGAYTVLGTDGYGLSESRDSLRGYFEVSRDWVVFAALSTLAQANKATVADASGLRVDRRPGPRQGCPVLGVLESSGTRTSTNGLPFASAFPRTTLIAGEDGRRTFRWLCCCSPARRSPP